MPIRTILYQYIKILIKHVFLLNFTHELLMILEKNINTYEIMFQLRMYFIQNSLHVIVLASD